MTSQEPTSETCSAPLDDPAQPDQFVVDDLMLFPCGDDYVLCRQGEADPLATFATAEEGIRELLRLAVRESSPTVAALSNVYADTVHTIAEREQQNRAILDNAAWQHIAKN